jgi:hypothetical protein
MYELRDRADAKGSEWTKIVVPTIPFSSLIDRFGARYYQIDIEGADILCLETLMKSRDRPNFISIERQPYLANQLKELRLLKALGYGRGVETSRVLKAGIPALPRPPNRGRA